MGYKKCLWLAILAVPFLCVSASGQYVNYRVTREAEGLFLSWDSPGNQFSLEVKGKDVTTGVIDDYGRPFFKADGINMIVQPAMVSEFIKPSDSGRVDALSILKAHKDWESHFVETEIVKKRLDVKAMPQKLADGRDALLWEYEVPKGSDTPYKQMVYLTVMNGSNFVLMLNCQLKSKEQADAARQLLLNTAATIKPTAIRQDGPVVLELKQKPD